MKNGGQIPWNVKPICETSQIYYLMGRRPMKDVLGNHLKDRLFLLVHWLSIILLQQRTSQESINLARKSYLDCSSDTHCTRVEFGRVTYWLQTLRETMNAFPKEKGKFYFSSRRWTNQTPWRRSRLENIHHDSAATKWPHLTKIMNNLSKALSQHATQSGMITKLGLLKSGILTLRCVSDRANPLSPLGERHASLN